MEAGAIWGSINGTLSAQSDLWYALQQQQGGGSGDVGVNTLVHNTSSNWNTSYNIATAYSSVSGSFATNTLLQSTSALLTPLTLTNTLTSQLVTNTAFTNYQTNVANTTATLLPTSVYQSTSGSFVPNTLLQSTSALLTPLTLTNTLTSQLLPTTIYQSASSNWQGTYTTVQSNSGSWGGSSGPYTFLTATSSIRPLSGNNTTSGNWSSVLGGVCNTASGTYSTVVAGFSGQATGYSTFVGAGSGNCATGCYSSVVGGKLNTASNCYGVIVGGANNCIGNLGNNGQFNFIGGGYNNQLVCGDGNPNTAYSVINGGTSNIIWGNTCAVIGGGSGNLIQTGGGPTGGVIGGGLSNKILSTAYYSVIAGGSQNCVNNTGSTISGGYKNIVSGQPTGITISGGRQNTASGSYAYIGGGCTNNASTYALVVGGCCNTASGNCSSIVGGSNNIASGIFSFVAGGSANDTKGFANTFILGTGLSALSANYTYVNNLSSQGTVNALGGNSNQWNSVYTSYNTTSSSFATTLSLSATTLKVYDKAVTYTVALSDNNSAIHLDTTSASISALFPSNLTEGFSVALMNTGTNYLYLSSALPLVSLGNSLSGKGSGAFTYVHSGNLYAVGRF